MNIVKIWNDYWFSPGSNFDLAVLRLAVVGLQCFLLLSYTFPTLTYTLALPEYIYQPRLLLKIVSLPWGALPMPEAGFMIGAFWLLFLFGLLSFVGLFTNVSLAVFAIGNILLQAFIYSFGDIHHTEAILFLCLLVLAASPSGKILSLDSYWKRRKSDSKGQTVLLLDLKDKYAGWPIRFMQWFFPMMYLSAVVSKLTRGGLEWANGISLQYYMILEGFKSDSDLALYVSQFHYLLKYSEIIVLLFQATFFLIIFFPRLKWVYLPLGLAFHFIIYVTLRAPFPQWILLYMIYVPWGSVIIWLTSRRIPLTHSSANR